jgi:hypothetical protein
MSQSEKSLPDAWLARLFDRLTAIYGSQKVGAMWLDADMGQVKAAWGQALAKYPPACIAAALQDLPEMPSAWPPTLPEFVTLVREQAEAARVSGMPPLLGHDEKIADPDSPTVKAALAELRQFVQARRMPS